MRAPALGISFFDEVIKKEVFYVDKTYFIKDLWNSNDKITLITRPRRFGKTLTLSMVETFFSNKYANRSDLFEGLSIWKDEYFRKMQGTYPVIFVSFANVKPTNYKSMMSQIKTVLAHLYRNHTYLLDSDKLFKYEKQFILDAINHDISEEDGIQGLLNLSAYLYRHFDKKVFILIDEYDTPMLEAYVSGFWDDAIVYIRQMFHAAFKDNPYLERGLMTGITRITQESLFSDLNNLRVVTTTSTMYEDCFGFTKDEVFSALEEYQLTEYTDNVKLWYDGFQFGNAKEIYNPWSIINFLGLKEFKPYWMNTSSNALVGKLIREGTVDIKNEFEIMLNGDTVFTTINENITYAELTSTSEAIWSWLLASGYIKIVEKKENGYEIALTNYEVRHAFYSLIRNWFSKTDNTYTSFIKMLLRGDLEQMQYKLEKVLMYTFSYFDVGSASTENEKAEQFYHGFTLGLIADLNYSHHVTSNRESGFGRYDICIEPIDKSKHGIIIEFKLFDSKTEKDLQDTGKRALKQIEDMNYEANLRGHGIEQIRKYGFAFRGKEVLIVE